MDQKQSNKNVKGNKTDISQRQHSTKHRQTSEDMEKVVTDETTAAASLRPQQRTVDEEDNQIYETTTPLTLGPITQGEVSNIIKGLNNKSAIGPDDVSAKLLKKYEEKLSSIVANHINASLTRGQFPDTMKRAKVTPIFKAGDRPNVCNYRLISVLSSI
jgi:pyruvate-formate lyase